MKQNELTQTVEAFSKRIKNSWQIIFLAAVAPYGVSLLHFFYYRPGLNPDMREYLRNIDLISYLVAIGLAVAIFAMKRKYFSPRFSRMVVEYSLKEDSRRENEALLKQVLSIIRGKMMVVWFLGFLLVLDGVVFYWLTFSDRNNMHIYFVIGAFSLLINYPRSDLFIDIPRYVAEGKKEFSKHGG